ncbi:MAG: hypothetical protein QXE06_08355 [Candidatus Bathyarchaeia archaeon]
MMPAYIPYIKYVIAPGTRFERDKKVLFDPDGEVAQGKPLLNYGWAPTGLKEFIEALYVAKNESLEGFNAFYSEKILGTDRDILEVLREEGLIGKELPALLIIKIRENVEVPALLVNVDRMVFKRCQHCNQSWRNVKPPKDFVDFLRKLGIENVVKVFQCSRQLCKLLCEYYSYCEKSYTSTEGLQWVENEKIECLKNLISFMAGRISQTQKWECVLRETVPTKLGCKEIKTIERKKRLDCKESTTIEKRASLDFIFFKKIVDQAQEIKCTTCIERSLRFDFTPLRYFFFDHKTWDFMQKQRYCKIRGQRNIDALPTRLLSDFINSYDKYRDGTQLIAPIHHKGVLEAFLNVSAVKFELKHSVEYKCNVCNLVHKITNIPIKAMFRDSDVFKHEAYFADLIWNKIWEIYPKQFCDTFHGKANIKISESIVIKREVKSKDLDPASRFSLSSYDYVIDLNALGLKRCLLFDLTTGLWKKSGFHEIGKTTEEYVETWRELLFNIPKKLADVYAIWYIVINSTEDKFFDETAPQGVKSIDELVNLITSADKKTAIIIKSDADLVGLDLKTHKFIVIPIFNSSSAKGEARWEIRRLEEKRYDKILMWKILDRLLR